jgi:hypothetical protein
VPLWVHLSLFGECRKRTELALAKLDDGAEDATRLRMQLSAALGWSLMYGQGRARDAGPALFKYGLAAEPIPPRKRLGNVAVNCSMRSGALHRSRCEIGATQFLRYRAPESGQALQPTGSPSADI